MTAVVHIATAVDEDRIQRCSRCDVILAVVAKGEDPVYKLGDRVAYTYPEGAGSSALPMGSYVVPEKRKPLVPGEAYCHEPEPLRG